jgi:UDP-N-acetylmuramoylalanine--D-glutamate ligase
MSPKDVAVIPQGDERLVRQARRGLDRLVTFATSASSPKADVACEGATIVHRSHGYAFPRDILRIPGWHNVENACASIALAADLGVSQQPMERALAEFEGLSHRTAFVGEVGGVRYYDDSKGTNVGASVAALRGLAEDRAVLIAGGRDKLGDYEPLVAALLQKGRALVLVGEAADRIEASARGVVPIARAASMQEAVQLAQELSRPGDAVLLSPACSSFDMFRDYKERGDVFALAVRNLLPTDDPGAPHASRTDKVMP